MPAAPPTLPQLVGALALATDLALGHPLEQGLGGCLVATRVAGRLGLPPTEREHLFHVSLLRHIGCTTDSADMARRFGDERGLGAHLAPLVGASSAEYVRATARFAVSGKAPLAAAHALARASVGLAGLPALTRAMCEVATALARRLGLADEVVTGLGMVAERWDGKGLPGTARGAQIPRTVRIAQVADLVAALHDLGHDDPGAVLARRSGTAFDPEVVAAVREDLDGLRTALDTPSRWDDVQRHAPAAAPLQDVALDAALGVVADFVDLKSPFLAGHSCGVAALARRAAVHLRLPAADATDVHHAGLVHDLGRVSVSTAIWDKPGRLTAGEWEAVRLHAYHTERLLGRVPYLARLGAVAAGHHERLDGSGYHRGVAPAGPAACLLAAADAYHAMREPRAHRPALGAEAAAGALRAEVVSGRLAGDAAGAVLAAAGHRPGRDARPAGLTGREVEVLRLIARGSSTREVARALRITPKTADNHIQSIYGKAGVRSRAAATLFAMRHGLVDPLDA
ncbi:MAG: HD domain-containing phosphohydrolase [Pseudonocardia sp.]